MKVALVAGDSPAAVRQAMNRRSVAPIVAGSPRCSMIATGVGDRSRIVTSSRVKGLCMILLLALSSGPKAESHEAQSGVDLNAEGDGPNRRRKARAKASGAP